MKIIRDPFEVLLVVYIVGFLATFGFAYQSSKVLHDAKFNSCMQSLQGTDFSRRAQCNLGTFLLIEATAKTAAWPLYWSVRVVEDYAESPSLKCPQTTLNETT